MVNKVDFNEGKMESMFAFLVELRDSGVTNMWGAPPYLQRAFGISHNEASSVFLEWVKSFDKVLE